MISADVGNALIDNLNLEKVSLSSEKLDPKFYEFMASSLVAHSGKNGQGLKSLRLDGMKTELPSLENVLDPLR